jgi:hypothetical protein
MNHAELTSKISELTDIIESRKYKLKLAKQGITFILQTAKESNSDSSKIRLADAYIDISRQEYELYNLTDKLKSFKKAFTKLAA